MKNLLFLLIISKIKTPIAILIKPSYHLNIKFQLPVNHNQIISTGLS